MMQLYDDTIIIRRLKTSSGNKRTLVATATADASVQPLTKEGGELMEGRYGSTYVAYVEEDTPAKKGDQVTDKNGYKYTITDIIIRDYGALPHKELIMQKDSNV